MRKNARPHENGHAVLARKLTSSGAGVRWCAAIEVEEAPAPAAPPSGTSGSSSSISQRRVQARSPCQHVERYLPLTPAAIGSRRQPRPLGRQRLTRPWRPRYAQAAASGAYVLFAPTFSPLLRWTGPTTQNPLFGGAMTISAASARGGLSRPPEVRAAPLQRTTLGDQGRIIGSPGVSTDVMNLSFGSASGKDRGGRGSPTVDLSAVVIFGSDDEHDDTPPVLMSPGRDVSSAMEKTASFHLRGATRAQPLGTKPRSPIVTELLVRRRAQCLRCTSTCGGTSPTDAPLLGSRIHAGYASRLARNRSTPPSREARWRRPRAVVALQPARERRPSGSAAWRPPRARPRARR